MLDIVDSLIPSSLNVKTFKSLYSLDTCFKCHRLEMLFIAVFRLFVSLASDLVSGWDSYSSFFFELLQSLDYTSVWHQILYLYRIFILLSSLNFFLSFLTML